MGIHVAHGQKILQMHGFSMQVCGKTSKGCNFNSTCLCKKYVPKCSQFHFVARSAVAC